MHTDPTPYAIRSASLADFTAVLALCAALWPDEPESELGPHLHALLAGEPWSTLPLVVFVAERAGELIGFVEVGLRSHAEACDGRSAVGFIEGWYVHPAQRRQGVGGALVARAEAWAREQGARELASNTWLGHQLSIDAHRALGFEVVESTVHFRKPLG